MAENLKRQTIGALIWNLVDRLGQQILQFVVVIIVANILLPDDYALVAMLTIFTAIGNLIIESGFGAALIQRKDAGDREFSSVFWFNLVMSIVLYALLMAATPLIVAYYGEPQLYRLSAVVFLVMPVNATMLIQTTLFTKQIRFKLLARINIISMCISSACAIIMAVAGCGVWTLAWQPVTLAAAKSVQLWACSSWRPKRVFSLSVIKSLFGFASSLLLSGLLNTLFVNIYSLVIPKLYPKRQLGLLTQGNKICDPIVSLVYGSVQNATYPIFSNIQDEHERLIHAYRKTIRFTSFLTFPLLFGAIAVAPPLFHILFKEVWWSAIPFFQLLCLGGCFTILTAINNNFIKVSGRSSAILKIEVLKIVFTVIAIALLLHQSVLAMVGGLIAIRLLVHVVNMFYSARLTGYRFIDQLQDTLPYMLIASVMLVAVYGISLLIHNDWLLLLCQVPAGAIIYLSIAYITGSKIMKESLDLLRHKQG